MGDSSASNWKLAKLSWCASFQEGYVNPSQSVSSYFGEEVKWLRAVDLNNSFVRDTSRRLSREGYESAGKSATLFEPGTIAISKSGTIGRLGILQDYMCGNRAVINIRPDSTVCDSRFVFYNLLGRRDEIDRLAEGSVQRNLYCSALGSIEIELPPLGEQRAIAHILGTLDDKIELNRRMNETLEAMARALFKSWFVDFDPVRAKVEGRDPALPASLAELFPGGFEDSEAGVVPAGWKVKPIAELAGIVGGSTPSTANAAYWLDGSYFWATPKDLSSLSVPVLLATERRITEAGLSQISSGLLPVGTVLLSSRAPIGYLAVAEVPVAINQGFIAMTAKPDISNIFLLLWARSAHEQIVSRANGSTFLEISKANFRSIPAVVPTECVMSKFDSLARPLYEIIVNNERASITLTTLRDTLLPKLISGELRVKAAEKIVEAVA